MLPSKIPAWLLLPWNTLAMWTRSAVAWMVSILQSQIYLRNKLFPLRCPWHLLRCWAFFIDETTIVLRFVQKTFFFSRDISLYLWFITCIGLSLFWFCLVLVWVFFSIWPDTLFDFTAFQFCYEARVMKQLCCDLYVFVSTTASKCSTKISDFLFTVTDVKDHNSPLTFKELRSKVKLLSDFRSIVHHQAWNWGRKNASAFIFFKFCSK